MELRNRVKEPIAEVLLAELEKELFDIFCLQKNLRRGVYTMEKRIEMEKQLEMLRESFSKTSRKLWKGHLTDIDAEYFIVLISALRFYLETWENSDYSVDTELERLFADVCAKVDKITVSSCLLDDPSCKELVEKVSYAVVVSAVALLCSVYQYLLGYVLKGGTKAYSSGSLDFRDTFVSLLLFQGSYVWIFFRDVAPRKVYRRSKKDGAGRVLCYYGKYEPRFKPPREKLPGGTSIKFDHLPLGGYESERDAEIVWQIAGFYYGKDEGRIELRDGSYFTIPAVPPEQEQSLCGKERAQWVAARAKEVFRDFQLRNNAMNLPSQTNTVAVRDFSEHAVSEEITVEALWDAADAHPVDSEFVDSLCADGEGLEGTAASPSSADLNLVDSFIAVGEDTPTSPSMAEQVVLRMERPQSVHLETSDAGSIAKLDIITQQLKEQIEAEISRRIVEQHEQHLQREKQLEEEVLRLRRENELLKCLI